MSCIFNFFHKKNHKQPELRIVNPLNLDDVPTTLTDLRALEGALLDTLGSIHYRINDYKAKIRSSIQEGHTNEARDSIANLTILKEKKQVFEKRLETVRAKVQEIQSNP